MKRRRLIGFDAHPFKNETTREKGRHYFDYLKAYILIPLNVDTLSNLAKHGTLYVTLATKEVPGTPFLIGGDFILSSSRETVIVDHPVNKSILKEVTSLYKNTIGIYFKLIDATYTDQCNWLWIHSIQFKESPNDALFERMKKDMRNHLTSMPLSKCSDGHWRHLASIYIAPREISNLFKEYYPFMEMSFYESWTKYKVFKDEVKYFTFEMWEEVCKVFLESATEKEKLVFYHLFCKTYCNHERASHLPLIPVSDIYGENLKCIGKTCNKIWIVNKEDISEIKKYIERGVKVFKSHYFVQDFFIKGLDDNTLSWYKTKYQLNVFSMVDFASTYEEEITFKTLTKDSEDDINLVAFVIAMYAKSNRYLTLHNIYSNEYKRIDRFILMNPKYSDKVKSLFGRVFPNNVVSSDYYRFHEGDTVKFMNETLKAKEEPPKEDQYHKKVLTYLSNFKDLDEKIKLSNMFYKWWEYASKGDTYRDQSVCP